MEYAVTKAWSTDLEPGTWYEISYADRPHLIAGFVFAPPETVRGIDQRDYRDIDGHKLSKRDNDHRAKVAAWSAAISRYQVDSSQPSA